MIAVVNDDAVVMPNEADTAVGKRALRAEYEHRFTVFEYHRDMHLDDWITDSEVAVVRCHTTGSLTFKVNGATVDAVAREVFVLVKADDRWKIRCYMFNLVKPMQAATQ